jgi:hypothetical protein
VVGLRVDYAARQLRNRMRYKGWMAEGGRRRARKGIYDQMPKIGCYHGCHSVL